MDKKIEQLNNDEGSKKDDLLSKNYSLNSSVNPSPEDIDSNEKNADKRLFILISLVALIIVGFLFWYNSSQFQKSLDIDVPDWILAELDTKSEEEKLTELKEKDTDQDGLTDYAELYQYGTSIFLADTDSDGYSDQEEVLAGHDALCPTGQDCNLLRFITPKTKLSTVIQDVNNSDITIEEAVIAEFKVFLLDNGLSQEDLDKATDGELLEFLSAMAEIESENISNSSTTPDQIRQFLLNQPDADEETINSLSDEELLQIQKQFSNN